VLCNGKERGKTLNISRQLSPTQILMDKKQPESVEYCNCLSGMVTNNARCTREVIPRIAMAKAAFNKKNPFFTSNLYLNLWK
jgi:hypothetical protein